jgi:hypothetical protein
MSAVNNYTPLLQTISLTEINYNRLYIDTHCCLIRIINRILFIICNLTPLLRGCCLGKAQGSITIEDEYRAMKGYALAKEALCAKKADSVNLFVLAYFTRRAQLSSLDPALLSKALENDLKAAGIDSRAIFEIQQKTTRVSTALSLTPSTLEQMHFSRLATELLNLFFQVEKDNEAISTLIDLYLTARQNYLEPENLTRKALYLRLYQLINQDLHRAFYADSRHTYDLVFGKSSYKRPAMSRSAYRDLMQVIIQKLPIEETITPHELFHALFALDWRQNLTAVPFDYLFSDCYRKPLHRIFIHALDSLQNFGAYYHAICMRIQPTAPHEIRQHDAMHLARCALIDTLEATSHTCLDSYQEWMSSDKQTRRRYQFKDLSAEECELANQELVQVATALPLFQRFNSLSKEESQIAASLINKILHTNRGGDNPSAPLMIFNQEIEKVAQIVLNLQIPESSLSQAQKKALKAIKEKWGPNSKGVFYRWDLEQTALNVFELRPILLKKSKKNLSKEDFQLIQSLINIMTTLKTR